jgi:hypothetical protein
MADEMVLDMAILLLAVEKNHCVGIASICSILDRDGARRDGASRHRDAGPLARKLAHTVRFDPHRGEHRPSASANQQPPLW